MSDTKRPDPTRLLQGTPTERASGATDSTAVTANDFPPSQGHLFLGGRYRYVELIGSGGQGEVWICEETLRPNQRWVVKRYPSRNANVRTELLAKLKGKKHKDVLYLHELAIESGMFYEIQELALGGNLWKAHSVWPEAELRRIVIPQIVDGLHFCHHELGIVHRDIKPENILFRDESQEDLALGDFGFSSLLEAGEAGRLTETIGGTRSYIAPEVSRVDAFEKRDNWRVFIDPKVDYYSFGMTLLALVQGEMPFEGEHFEIIYQRKLRRDLPIRDSVSPAFRDLLNGLMHGSPEGRWSENEVRRWLRGETVPVPAVEVTANFRYRLGPNLEARSPEQLARMMLDNPSIAQEHIEEGTLARSIESQDQALGVKIWKAIRDFPGHPLVAITYLLDASLPYILAPARAAHSPEEVAGLINQDHTLWEAGKEHLFGGRIPAWLRSTGRRDITDEWFRDVDKYRAPEFQDAGLERFLHLLDPNLPLPILQIEPRRLDGLRVRHDQPTTIELRIRNTGRGYLTGHIERRGEMHGVSFAPDTFSGRDATTINITIPANQLQLGRSYQTRIRIISNTQTPQITVPLDFRVVVPLEPVLQRVTGFAVVGAVYAGAARLALSAFDKVPGSTWLPSVPLSQLIDVFETHWFTTGALVLPIFVGLLLAIAAAIGRWRWLRRVVVPALLLCPITAVIAGWVFLSIETALNQPVISPSVGWPILGALLGGIAGLHRSGLALGATFLRYSASAALLLFCVILGVRLDLTWFWNVAAARRKSISATHTTGAENAAILKIPAGGTLNVPLRGSQPRSAVSVNLSECLTGGQLINWHGPASARVFLSPGGRPFSITQRIPNVPAIVQFTGPPNHVVNIECVGQSASSGAATLQSARAKVKGQIPLLDQLPSWMPIRTVSSLNYPPGPYRDNGACPGEGCSYGGRWEAKREVHLYTDIGSGQQIAQIETGEIVTVPTGAVVTVRPGVERMKRAIQLGPIQIQAGDVLYTLTYRGEGDRTICYRGRLIDANDGAWSDAERLAEPISEWWARVSRASGETGWTQEVDAFTGKTRYEEAPSSSASVSSVQPSRNTLIDGISAAYQRRQWSEAERRCLEAERVYVNDASISKICTEMRQTRRILNE